MATVEKHKVEHIPPQRGKWVRDRLLFPLFGITPEMARKYRERGTWLEDKHWRFDPMRRVVYNPSEIENWFEGKV